jgi:hypothetical protein
MSTTKYKKFTGHIGWNHLVTPDEYLGEKKWKLDFYPDDYEAVKEMGSKLRPKVDEKGTLIRPTRNVSRVFDGVETKFTPPVLTYNGEAYDGMYIPKGSRIEVDLCFYNAGKFGTGTRLQGVKILELAEEEAREPQTENQEIEANEEVSTKAIPVKKKLPF